MLTRAPSRPQAQAPSGVQQARPDGRRQWVSAVVERICSSHGSRRWSALLDEPDAHLHPSLQEQLLDSLREISSATSKQVLVATHSSEILRSTAPADILQVRGSKGGRYLTEEQQKVGLLAGLGSDYAPRVDHAKRDQAAAVRGGDSDLGVLKILAATLDLEWPRDVWTEWTTTRTQKERKQLYLALKEEIPSLVVLSLRDRDDEPAEGSGADLIDKAAGDDGQLPPSALAPRYIESYLIWPAAIAAATGLGESAVNDRLAEHHALSVTERFTESHPPRLYSMFEAKRYCRRHPPERPSWGSSTPAPTTLRSTWKLRPSQKTSRRFCASSLRLPESESTTSDARSLPRAVDLSPPTQSEAQRHRRGDIKPPSDKRARARCAVRRRPPADIGETSRPSVSGRRDGRHALDHRLDYRCCRLLGGVDYSLVEWQEASGDLRQRG